MASEVKTNKISPATGTDVTIGDSGDVVTVPSATIDFTGLPTSDPSVAGRLWNDSGAVKVSAG